MWCVRERKTEMVCEREKGRERERETERDREITRLRRARGPGE